MKAHLARFTLPFAVLLVGLALAGCNGTVNSVSFPAASPWQDLTTGILSPTDDLVAVSAGAGVTADLVPGIFTTGIQAVVTCKGTSNEPHIETCSDRACD